MEQQVNDLIEEFAKEQDIVKRATLLKQLQQLYNVPLITISRRTGLKPSHVSHIMRINRLSPLIIDGYYSQAISATHLFVLARLRDQTQAAKVYERVLADNLSVAATEVLVRETLYNLQDTGEHLKKEQIDMFVRKMNHRGIDATVLQTRTKGKITLQVKGNLEHTSQVLADFMNEQERREEPPATEILSVADL